jgi:hypothetical protein
MANNLLTPILNDIRSVNFFNGRLLTGEDLTAEQKANRLAHGLLGQAIGAGVAYGFEVSEAKQSSSVQTPVLAVAKGLAINRNGTALLLQNDTEIALVRPAKSVNGAAKIFEECTPIQPGVYVADPGIYLFTVGPATASQGLAEVSGVNTGSVPCNSNYNGQGVQFRLVNIALTQLNLTPSDLTDNRLRNLVAYQFFGVADWASEVTDPFKPAPAAFGLMDQLRAAQIITDCEVPLAVLYWTATDGLVFVDMWAVRRLIVPQDASPLWTALAGRRRASEGLAMFLQFESQVIDLLRPGAVSTPITSLQITDYFRYVPPAGIVPILDIGSPKGFDANTFFGKFSSGTPTVLPGTKFNQLIHNSLLHVAVDLSRPGMLQLYQLAPNTAAVAQGSDNQIYILFVNRDSFGFAEHDDVANTFSQAWQVYRGLVNKRVFLPSEATSDAIGARFAILSAEQDVMAVANQKATLAAAQDVNYQDALNAFSDLYQIQHELVLLFQSPIPGITDLQGRDAFTQALNTYLETAVPGGGLSLNQSLQNGDLRAAINAQQAINLFVGSWTGTGVAIGFIDVVYKSSPRGVQIVPGDPTPYPHIFTVSNKTDKVLTINLNGSVAAAHGDWTNSVKFLSDGIQVGSVTLASSASQDVTASLQVPLTAQIGDTATLSVVATAPAPQNKQGSAQLPMTVAAASGPPVVRSVTFTQIALPPVDTTNVNPGPPPLSYIFSVRYSTTQPPLVGHFNLTVTLDATPAGSAGNWGIDFAGATRIVLPGAPGQQVVQTPVTLDSGANQDTPVTVRIRAPLARATQDQVATVNVSIDSTDLPDATSAKAGPFTITLKKS